MYSTSQCCGYSGGGSLESIAGSYQGRVSYSAAAPVQSSIPIGIYSGSGGYGPSGGSSQVNYHQQEYNGLDLAYKRNKAVEEVIQNKVNENYTFFPDDFLKTSRGGRRFIGKAEEIKEHVEETFRELAGFELPQDIRIQVCNKKEFSKLTHNPGVVGLSINRKEDGLLSDIFILNDELARVMLTVGHELGHVLANPLQNKRDEEAKAFAFSFAWMEVIKEKNIAGLGKSIVVDNPAKNGIHDLAFNFVWKLVKKGKKALELYSELVKKLVKVDSKFY